MLNPIQLTQPDATVTRNAMVLTEQWDPRKVSCSQLHVDDNGVISVSDNALKRDQAKHSGSSFFEPEKNILINHLQFFIALIQKRGQEIAASEIITPANYYNQSNALQGLIHLLDKFTFKYKSLVKYLRKAENKVKHKKAYQHLISADYQNLMLNTRLGDLDELLRGLRETQQQTLTHNGQFNNEVEDTLDHPLFILGEGLEAFIPFNELTISRFIRHPRVNPLCNILKIMANLDGVVHHLTLCPSWQTEGADVAIEGPCAYFARHFREHVADSISYRPITLSAMIDFVERDTATSIKPFVQTMIELALNNNLSQVALHAPIGCSNLLYALGFRTKDRDVHPTLEEQEAYVVKSPSTVFPIGYNVHEPMIMIDCIDESFIDVTSLRVFYLELCFLSHRPVYLENREAPTTWMQLLDNKRYLASTLFPHVLPEFNYLPYRQFTPSFTAIRERELTGRMPPDRIRYERVAPDAADIHSQNRLQTIGAFQATLEDEDLASTEYIVRSFHM